MEECVKVHWSREVIYGNSTLGTRFELAWGGCRGWGEELSETNAKLDDKNDEASKLSTKVDQMVGASKRLKGEVSTLQKELAAGAKTQVREGGPS